ncbi:MAG: NFACT RNA binding domain-containing protein, partial [Ignavibacteria bacterium]
PVNYLYTSGNDLHLSLIPLEHTQASELKKFDDINQLLTEYIKLKFYSEKTKKLKISRSHETEQKISNVKRKLDGINTQLKHCEDSDVLRKSGDIILQNLDSISKGDKKFSYNVTGIDEITIKLKENLSPVENAQNYFDKYKKQKASVNILKSKIINLQKEQKKLEAELNEIKEMNDIKKLIKDEKRSEENKNDETSRFRKFRINDKYEVWVGRDSISNDVLTTRYAAQNDLWFHVRGASGSHTVLKINNSKEHIPKEAILGAASIAAYYSKARNSSNVPVAYCEKKFVKKKKGFKSGTVTMEREKVVFVKPLLPAES